MPKTLRCWDSQHKRMSLNQKRRSNSHRKSSAVRPTPHVASHKKNNPRHNRWVIHPNPILPASENPDFQRHWRGSFPLDDPRIILHIQLQPVQPVTKIIPPNPKGLSAKPTTPASKFSHFSPQRPPTRPIYWDWFISPSKNLWSQIFVLKSKIGFGLGINCAKGHKAADRSLLTI